MTALTSVGSPHPKCGPLCFPDHRRGKHPPAHALTGKHSPGDLSVLTGRLYLLTQQAQVLAEPDHHSLGVGVAEGTSTAFRCRPHSLHQGAEATGSKPALLSLLPPPLWGHPSKNHHFFHIVYLLGVAY